MITSIIYVGIGGAFGAVCRFLISSSLNKQEGFPFGTLCANAIGCFLLGLLGTYLSSKITPEWKLVISTGFLGALTTFSTFSFETLQFVLRDQWKMAAVYFFVQIISGAILTLIGMTLAQRLLDVS
ncbi:MAG: fluoride efflux transporter CrcB [Deltaproteobacteria bacterium]|nr:fluoride efflux transporter CrcB [Deltaproteobacteria bacterium]